MAWPRMASGTVSSMMARSWGLGSGQRSEENRDVEQKGDHGRCLRDEREEIPGMSHAAAANIRDVHAPGVAVAALCEPPQLSLRSTLPRVPRTPCCAEDDAGVRGRHAE